jgi:hypothetical protein
MSYVIPSHNSALKQIFLEKVPGTDQDLVGPQLIAYLKWLIYVSAFDDRSLVAHDEFYQKQVLRFQNPANYRMWRSLLFKELEEWYTKHPPSSKKRKSTGGASQITDIVVDEEFFPVDNYIDFLDNPESGAGTAGGARAGPSPAAAAAAAAGSSLWPAAAPAAAAADAA